MRVVGRVFYSILEKVGNVCYVIVDSDQNRETQMGDRKRERERKKKKKKQKWIEEQERRVYTSGVELLVYSFWRTKHKDLYRIPYTYTYIKVETFLFGFFFLPSSCEYESDYWWYFRRSRWSDFVSHRDTLSDTKQL